MSTSSVSKNTNLSHWKWSNICVCKIHHFDVFGRGNIRKICTLPCWNLILYAIFCHISCDMLNNEMNFARKLFILFVIVDVCMFMCPPASKILWNASSFLPFIVQRKIHLLWKDDFKWNGMLIFWIELYSFHFLMCSSSKSKFNKWWKCCRLSFHKIKKTRI